MSEESNIKKSSNIYRSQKSVPSGEESTIACEIKKTCNTCEFINTPYQQSLEKKWQRGIKLLEQSNLLQKAKAIPPKPSEKPLGYRNHAKLAVRGQDKAVNKDPAHRFAIGLFAPGTHNIVDIGRCPLHRETINPLIADLKKLLDGSSLTPYDEETLSGDLRYIAIRSSHLTDELMITFVMNQDSHRKELKSIVAKMIKEYHHQIQAAYININEEQTNVIFGQESRHLSGANRLRENLCEFSYEIGPTSFFQVNPTEAERIYRRIEQLCGYNTTQSVAWDLYCGVGQISLILARSGYRVMGVEMNPQAIRDAQKNAAGQLDGISPTFIAARVENEIDSFPAWAQAPRLIVTNPSRKGLDPAVRNHLKEVLSKNPGCEFLYVSCEIKSLARDLEDLCKEGMFLRQIEAFDMFPFTDKLEWLAVIK